MRKSYSAANITAIFLSVTLIIISGCGKDEDPDRHDYRTVTIGEQVWMAENLRTTTYNDGTEIPNVTSGSEWSKLKTGAYAWYDNDQGNAGKHGALYNWYAVEAGMLCPVGWRVATDDDWKLLAGTVDSDNVAGASEWEKTGYRGSDAGERLKAASGWTAGNGTDDFDFSVLPSGYRSGSGEFNSLGFYSSFWSSTPVEDEDLAWRHGFYFYGTGVLRYSASPEIGFPVRCVRDLD